MTFLPAELYAQIERSVPLVCVDFVPVRRGGTGRITHVGLILRDSPFGRVWCHLGGRVLYGETVANAIRRHARDTLDVDVYVGDDPQPDWVYQWFPDAVAPDNAAPDTADPDAVAPSTLEFGRDPRKHAVGLSFTVDLGESAPRPRNEAIEFGSFALDALPAPLWPGCEALLSRLTRQSRRSTP